MTEPIGAQSSLWRRVMFTAFASTYFRRKVRTRDGVFEVYGSPGSYLKFAKVWATPVDPVHERFIRHWVDHNAVVWDIGANLGLFAFPAALKTTRGRVYMFEPDVELGAYLLRSRRLSCNKRLDVALLSVAISNVDGTAEFQISKFSRAMNKLRGASPWHDREFVADETRLVCTMRIDTLSQTLVPPTVIKIDVEGAEMLVLEGGEATISKYRPVLLIEGPNRLWNQMGLYLNKHDYVLLDGATEHQSPLKEPVWDTVAVPKEKFTSAATGPD